MTRQDKLIVAVVLAPYLVFMLGLIGWIVWRSASGSPAPHGAVAVAVGFCCLTPLVMLATAAAFRRRGAQRSGGDVDKGA